MSLPDHDATVEYVNSVYDGAATAHEFPLPEWVHQGGEPVLAMDHAKGVGQRDGQQDPYGVRFGPRCHWCVDQHGAIRGGTGLRFDLPRRIEQTLRKQRSVTEVLDRNAGPPSKSLGVVETMGVQANWPLRMWWVMVMRHDRALLRILPPYEELMCQRCWGTGRAKS